jgi:putative MATE family efflux protein
MLAVDSALCGRLPPSAHALEALGYAVQVVFLLMVAMLGLLVGTVALVARAYGGGDHGRVNHLLVQSTQLTAIAGVVVAIVGALFARPLLVVLRASPEVADTGVAYLRPLFLGTPFFYLGLLYTGILRGVGNTRIPFLCAIVANVINAALNYGLVLGHLGLPALGVLGSAIGTVCAQFINLLLLIYVLRRGSIADLKLPFAIERIDRKLAVELYRVGWPAAIDMLILNAGFLSAMAMLGWIDNLLIAAHGLGLRIQGLAFVPGLGIAQATGAMVGQALGASDVPRAREIVRASLRLCAIVMCALAVMIFVAAYPLVSIFDVPSGSRLESFSVEWLRILGVVMVPASVQMAMMGLLQGAGATRTSLRINIWTTLAIQIPIAFVLGFAFDLGATGVWLSFPLAFVVKAFALFAAYRAERWAVTGVRVPAKS